jgi:MoxR-like ATPase
MAHQASKALMVHPKKKKTITSDVIKKHLAEKTAEKEVSEEAVEQAVKEPEKTAEAKPVAARTPPVTEQQKFKEEVEHYQKLFDELRYEVSKIVVGQRDILDGVLEAVLANGHCLVEGIPGIAKTLLLRTISVVTGSDFKRIQFTPDLLPTDIVGVTAYDDKKGFYTVKGPIFTNFVLGDEINRAPPKVQSALLESMQEKQVTIGKISFPLPNPFFVFATQNPIEQMGTYPLPEAQIDRFIYKLIMKYPSMEDEEKIMKQNISLLRFEDFKILPVMNPEDIIRLQNNVKKIYLDPKIEKYIVRLVDATRSPGRYNLELGKYIEFGSSPRASIALYIASKAHALLSGKIYVTPQDIKSVAPNIFRHRMILNYEGQAEEIKTEDIVKELLSKVPVV